MDKKYDCSNLFLKVYKYSQWYTKLDKAKSKSQPEEAIAGSIKLIPHKSEIKKESDDIAKSVKPPMPVLDRL